MQRSNRTSTRSTPPSTPGSATSCARAPHDPLDERDPAFIDRTLGVYDALLQPYFRPEVRGLENIPADGPVLLVGNHSGGTLIADTFVFAYAFYKRFGSERLFHQLVHDLAINMPMVAAGPAQVRRVRPTTRTPSARSSEGAALLVYPGGDYETYRPSWRQDRIEFGGRRGFLRLARKMDVPIVPVVAIGGQETALFVTRGAAAGAGHGLDRLTRIKVTPFQIAPPFGLTFLDLPTAHPAAREDHDPGPAADPPRRHRRPARVRARDRR